MKIKRNGSQPSTKGAADHFTGTVRSVQISRNDVVTPTGREI